MSAKASGLGLVQIKNAIARRGWKMSDDRWSLEASKILEPEKNWEKLELFANGCSKSSRERLLEGTPIQESAFKAFCQALEINSDDVVHYLRREDWRAAPDVRNFHGRQPELAILERWIVRNRCRLINIVGFAGIGKTSLVRGGIGKTDLSLKFARRVRGEFEYIIWRGLLNAPPLETLLAELIEFVSDNQNELATTTDGLITQLLHYLKQRRCLLILDNVESILQTGDCKGTYRGGYEEYGDFWQRISESEHQSCVLLTSRVKPRDLEDLEEISSVRSLELSGLDIEAGQAIFQDIARANNASFQATKGDWSRLISFYNGNPLALEITARHILNRFDGNLSEFLKHDLMVFGEIRQLLDWHFEHLGAAEKKIVYWLALNREAVSIANLKQDIFLPTAQKYLPETLDAIERQIPIEKSANRVTLQPVLIEYISERAIAEVCHELESGNLQLFNKHALIKASAKDYVKDSQIRLILQPIIDRLNETWELELQDSLENRLSKLLENLNRQIPGYTAGNLLNLMRYAGIDIEGYDFSRMTIWQADLQDTNLHQVNFAGCKFKNSSLTQDFGGIYAIAFSPNRDVFAVGDSSGGIRLFRLEDRQPCLYLKGHLENTFVTSLAFSFDGKFLASTSMDYTVKLWDIQTGKCLETLQGHQDWIWTVAFSPNGQTVASGGDDNTIRLWNIHTGDCRVLTSDSGWVWGIAFDPEGNIIASAGYDSTIRLWNADTGKCFKILQGHEDAVWSVAFHPAGQILASGSADNTVKLWDVKTGDCVATFIGHTREVRSVAFDADGKIVVSGSFDRTIKLWDFSTGKCFKTLSGHTDGVRVAAINSNLNILASGDSNQMLKLWDVNTGKCLKTWQGFANWVWTIALSPKGQLLASGSLDKTVKLWDLESGKEIAVLTGHRNWVWSVAFSPNGQILASSSDDESIKIWNVNTGKCLNTFHLQTNGGVWSVAFSPDGKLLASGSRDGSVRLWDLESGINILCIAGHSNYITDVTFSPDGKYIASCSGDRTIKLWSVETGECLTSIEDNPYKFMSLVFSPDGRMLVSGDELENLQLWDIKTGRCIQNFPGHTDTVWAIAFLNERTFASGSVDETIRLWDLNTGECLKILTGHTGWVRAISFTQDRQTLVSSSTDGTIRQWDLYTGQTCKLLRSKKPYEEMNIADVKGLTIAQKNTLIALGARD